MHIIELRASNLGILKAVRIDAKDKNTVVITGANANGKSTVLDAIHFALGGAKAFEKVRKPIRDGEERAEIVLKTDRYTVKRYWTANDKPSKLEVIAEDGFEARRPQDVLDELLGDYTFDPIAFTKLKPKDQRTKLMEMYEISTDDLDQEYELLYADRREINSKATALKGAIQKMESEIGEITTAESIGDLSLTMIDLEEQSDDIHDTLQTDNQKRDILHRKEESIREYQERINRLQAQLAEEMDKRDKLQVECQEIQETLLTNDDRVQLNTKADTIRKEWAEHNSQVARLKEWAKLDSMRTEAQDYEKRSEGLTELLKGNRQLKQERVTKVTLPVSGLVITDDGIEYDGIPLEQCSTAQRTLIGCMIVMKQNPKLRIMQIREGSNLDSHALATLEEIAKEHDFQIWIEKMDESGKVGIVMEDGEVKAVNS